MPNAENESGIRNQGLGIDSAFGIRHSALTQIALVNAK